MNFQSIAILGGDLRQRAVAEDLAGRGIRVHTFALSPTTDAPTLDAATEDADVILLPLPYSADGVRLFCPLMPELQPPRISGILRLAKGRPILGGRLPPEFTAQARDAGSFVADYTENGYFQLRNALPTAEGAIAVAMGEIPVTLDGTTVAVIGYGRIGRLLSEKLRLLGCRVTVYARRREVLWQIREDHLSPAPLSDGKGNAIPIRAPEGCRVIFNTVPARLLTREVLKNLPPDCVIVDLASAPGGVDRSAAGEYGIRTVWATALPGRMFPESAGAILARTVEEILTEEG